MNDINTNPGGSTCTYNPYINNCIHRLPCGLCTYLHILCPLGNRTAIIWTVTTGTTEEVQDGTL